MNVLPFPTSLSTSAALTGRYDQGWLTARDADGVVLRCRGTRMETGLAFAALHELLSRPAPDVAAVAHRAPAECAGRTGE